MHVEIAPVEVPENIAILTGLSIVAVAKLRVIGNKVLFSRALFTTTGD